VRNVFVRLEDDGIAGYGEASPNAFYGETWEGVTARLENARPFLQDLKIDSVADIEEAWVEAWPFLVPSRAAQCALDIALWDWLGRRSGKSVTELAWKHTVDDPSSFAIRHSSLDVPPRPVTTFATIGLSSAEELAAKVEELRGFPWIKIKSDQTASLEPIRYVRERSAARLAVDANCAWGEQDLRALAEAVAELGVVFLEQPFPPERDADLPPLDLPVMADESCVTEDDVAGLPDQFAGFNIKLVKCGGITPARRMVASGKERGKRLMVGCMLESSALIAAGAVIAQQTDYADLDGAWLVRDDPFIGWRFDHGILQPPPVPGLGIEPETGLFPESPGSNL
jgi:L-alanine-DL-glutamate epimerase-like enolase superfamily enzyme